MRYRDQLDAEAFGHCTYGGREPRPVGRQETLFFLDQIIHQDKLDHPEAYKNWREKNV